ncbi:MAG: SRPBCC domain-containing protein [Planctomycetes bacterium]|nr:SRPBCC domain-containing protein [Planctomycetota bacterium]
MHASTPIVVEQVFNAPIAVVWKAITDKDQMRQWFFKAMTDFEPESGFETQFNVRCEDRDYLHLWKIIDVVPEKRITYGWRYGGYSGNSTVVWEVSETPNGTKLVLTHEGQETFPQDDPVFSRESGQAGWDYFIHESLKAFLDGRTS